MTRRTTCSNDTHWGFYCLVRFRSNVYAGVCYDPVLYFFISSSVVIKEEGSIIVDDVGSYSDSFKL